MPWFIAPELLRHRSFSFSSESARARGEDAFINDVVNDMMFPIAMMSSHTGMQGKQHLAAVLHNLLTFLFCIL